MQKNNFKIKYPTGYQVKDIYNDNLDIHIILPNEEVYFATLFTLANIKDLMENDGTIHFWASDMIIVRSLNELDITTAIDEMISSTYFANAFSKIGTIQSVYKM